MASPNFKIFLNKSIAAMISAIEIYNKPDFKYREELFSIMAFNAWEIFLKSKILQINNNNMKAIYKMEPKKNKDGKKSKKKIYARTRHGDYQTHSFWSCYKILKSKGHAVHKSIEENWDGLDIIRNNSVHCVHKSNDFCLKVAQLGNATLLNYFNLIKEWFGISLEQYNFYLMPITFLHHSTQNIKISKQENIFLEFFNQKSKQYPQSSKFNFSINVNLELTKSSSSADALKVKITDDPMATPISLGDEKFHEIFPLSYKDLCDRLKESFENFKITPSFHKIKAQLCKNKELCGVKYLNPKTKKSKSTFYSYKLISEFAKHYKKRKK